MNKNSASENKHRFNQLWLLAASVIGGCLVWALVTGFGDLPDFILPRPAKVLARMLLALEDGTLAVHSLVTFSEVLAGILFGVSSAVILGYLLAKSRRLERVLSPRSSQAVPVVAAALLLVIRSDPGCSPKC
jgi:ABC-type nitrate/sulfonate/bicarbonate transport system permease component